MKKLFKSVALATVASSALLSGAAMADQKIAVVNMQEVMGSIPQTDAIRQTLENEFKDARAELAQLEKDIKYFQEKKKRDASIMSKKDVEDLDKQIADAFKIYQEKGQALQQQAGVRQNEETNKILALIRQAIDKVAADKKYDHVLNKQAALFSKPEHEITQNIIEQVSKIK
ncbi:OmpH family outer membrane protein [Thalassotalea marina]|uniref:Molecular chaperone n=1 Tax=Thalassotalea marina TaxID=1673741 RepID=A0A919BMD7_9GAMM|nr:OmpH family outer membrane protein [Thalassotalea marina]GHG01006.1 molecular chaperone [Thalassotalea marina]